MILLYRIFTTCLYPFLILLILLRKILKKEHVIRYKEKIYPTNFNVVRNKNSKLIWFHAASIGEFKSILPIINEINNTHNSIEFLITTVTLSSSNLAEEELSRYNNVTHRFFPLDVNFLVSEFLKLWKPNAIFLVDSEIWPNLILNAKKKEIPIAIINARITTKTFKRWMLFPKTSGKIFSLFNLCLTSNSETKYYLSKLSAKNVHTNGNIKLINKINEKNIKNPNEKFLLNNKFWLAASTHEGEEYFCLQTHLALKKKFKSIITIIAPRHINRVRNIKKVCEKLKLNVQILKKNELILDNKEIIIINSFGVLPIYYKYSKSVFIGKSMLKKLEGVGGQNPIDAAKLGCKVYHGPYVYNFKEVYEILEKNNITKKINSPLELGNNLEQDFNKMNKADNQITHSINQLGQKTLVDTMKYVNKFLMNEIK